MAKPAGGRWARVMAPEPPPSLKALFQPGEPRQRWVRYWVKDVIDGGMDLLLHNFLRLLPIDWCSALGGLLGRTLGRRSYPKADRRVQENLRHFHPEWTEPQVQAAATRLWDHLGRTMAEFSILHRLKKAGRLEVVGEHIIHREKGAGPAVILGVHTGNWEVLSVIAQMYGIEVYDIYEPPRNRFKHAIAVRARQRCGATLRLFPPGKETVLAFMRALRDGKAVAMFGDEETDGGIQAPFFDRPPHSRGNLAYIARIALQSKASVVPIHCRRSDGCRFRIEVGEPVALDPQGLTGEGLQANINRLNAVIEPLVYANLDQWYWLTDYRLED